MIPDDQKKTYTCCKILTLSGLTATLVFFHILFNLYYNVDCELWSMTWQNIAHSFARHGKCLLDDVEIQLCIYYGMLYTRAFISFYLISYILVWLTVLGQAHRLWQIKVTTVLFVYLKLCTYIQWRCCI